MKQKNACRNYNFSSRVEELVRKESGLDFRYPPTEKTRVLLVANFPMLGKVAALRFLEWLQLNPEGCVCLPTGKTPEHFIGWTVYFLRKWQTPEAQRELGRWGLDPASRPDMRSFNFVQIDEFYPMNPRHENSFAHYIRRFYFRGFGFDPKRALLMNTWDVGAPAGENLDVLFPPGGVDLSLRYRQPENEDEQACRRAVTAMDQYALEYEEKIRALGGIGFFLGGIGPDGHIGFNVRGAGFYSTTRLDQINYETAAAAASDLGGIEISRRKLVLTVGLGTITWNPTVTALTIAAGETKAPVIRDAVQEEPSILYPATALHSLPGAVVVATRGAARLLEARALEEMRRGGRPGGETIARILTDTACRRGKMLTALRKQDVEKNPLGRLMVEKGVDIGRERLAVAREMKEKIWLGNKAVSGMTFLHTGPHHDDIMLGYLPYIVQLVREPTNTHYFATLTSGFTSVSNDYARGMIDNLARYIERRDFGELAATGYFAVGNLEGRNRDVYQYLDGVAAASEEMRREGEARRMMRNMVELLGTGEPDLIRKKIASLAAYFRRVYAGRRDTPLVQKLKGMIREWEEELLWSHLGFSCDHIFHLRVGFYTGDIFSGRPEWARDIKPFLELLEKKRPNVVTVALDPEGSGPDTHYKVLQIIASALKAYVEKHDARDVRVLGYRNVWFRFHPAEANVYVPVSMNSLAIMNVAFHTCFGSQRSASFPSHEYDGPFCDLARKIMVEQYAAVKTCLGRDFFYQNPLAHLRASRGLNFLREMTCEEFFREARLLRETTEEPPASGSSKPAGSGTGEKGPE